MSELTLDFEGRKYTAVSFVLGNKPLLIVKAKKGYIACSYLDKQTSEHLGDVAAFVSGVNSFEELLHCKIRSMTAWAEEAGIREGMSVKKALEIMDG